MEQGVQKVVAMPTKGVELQASCQNLNINGASTSVFDVRKLGYPPLSRLAKINGDKKECWLFLSLHLNELTFFFGSEWKDAQVLMCAKSLYDNYYYFSAADWQLFFSRCKSLSYGKIFGQISPKDIMEWSLDFNNEWLLLSEELSINASNNYKTDKTEGRISETINKLKRY